MNNRKGLQLAYLVVGSLTVLEFLFVRGMFTWLIEVSAITVLGIVNVFQALRTMMSWKQHYMYFPQSPYVWVTHYSYKSPTKLIQPHRNCEVVFIW